MSNARKCKENIQKKLNMRAGSRLQVYASCMLQRRRSLRYPFGLQCGTHSMFDSRLYHKNPEFYHKNPEPIQEKSGNLFLLREASRLLFKFYVRSYIRTFISFRMYYRIPPPKKIYFFIGAVESRVRVGLPKSRN